MSSLDRSREVFIGPSVSIRHALSVIDESGLQIALVTDEEKRLKGVITDGDIRRGILDGVDLEAPVREVMNASPVTARPTDDRQDVLDVMRKRHIHQIPIIDSENRVVHIHVLDELIRPESRSNPVVIMAGGLGTRLRPLTKDRPKPLLEIGGKPILETILEGFIAHGFHRFYVAVNYKAKMIEDHFGDGSDWDVDIRYLHEEKRLGTAGPLSLLPDGLDETVFVMNGDLLTTLDFVQLLDFHRSCESTATMCVREYDMQVPYGVIETDGHRMTGLDEKPVTRYFVNAGIYVLEPETLKYVPENEFYDMTTLFEKLIDQNETATVFPVREYWQDVGQKEDFHRANGEYDEIFEG